VTQDCLTLLMVDGDAAEARPDGLARALSGAGLAAVVLLSAAPSPELLRAQVGACQASGAAALIGGDARLALAVNADGVHLPKMDSLPELEQAYRAARALLGAGRTVGASVGLIRHDAMVLGELGADYIAFEDQPGADPQVLCDTVSWWAELFEVPCVALGLPDAETAARLAAAGADFVAAGPLPGLEAALKVLEAVSRRRGAGA
jgi:thiamine-phosphate pyrophosphorylase